MSLPKICVVCKEENDAIELTSPQFDQMLLHCELWSKIGRYNELYEMLSLEIGKSHTKLFHHRKCLTMLTHANHLARAQERYSAEEKNKNRNFYASDLCFVCQTDYPNVSLSQVKTEIKGQQILQIKSKCSEDIKARLASINKPVDAIQNKLYYHNRCLQREARTNDDSRTRVESSNCEQRLSIAKKLIESLKLRIDSLGTTDMKQIEDQYLKYLEDENVVIPQHTDVRKYLKTIMLSDAELMSKIDFFHHVPRKPAVIASKKAVEKLICEKHFNDDEKDEDCLHKASKIIRRELAKFNDWCFNGDFQNFETPKLLALLIQEILAGHKTLSELKKNELFLVSNNISQYICSNYKSDRQVSYQSRKNRGFEKLRTTPLSLGTALICYKNNRTRSEIDNFSKLGLCVTYEKLERIVTGMALSTAREGAKIGLGGILPPCIKKGIRPIFAADNIDLGSDYGSFHGADLMVAQDDDQNFESLFPKIFFETNQLCRSFPVSIKHEINENIDTTEEESVTFLPEEHPERYLDVFKTFQEYNLIWLFLTCACFKQNVLQPNDDGNVCEDDDGNVCEEDRLSDEEYGNEEYESEEYENEQVAANQLKESTKSKALSWSAFHSILSAPPNAITNIAILAPLYTRSPTEMPILMDILMKAQKISVLTVGEGKRAIITLDGDLYGRAIRIKNYKDRWIIRLGMLHTVIASLKCLGKYVEDSGIDDAWEVSGIYGKATIAQIIEGRHIYRGIEAHSITLICLHHLYSKYIFTEGEINSIEEILSNVAYTSSGPEDKVNFIDNVSSVHNLLKIANVFENLLEPKVPLNDTAKFLKNYMNQIFNLLNYIGSTRTKNWNQHLSASEDMSKYFFAHDQYKYARWTTVYLADMMELKTVDKESWDFLSTGHFCVSKNKVPFTSIDPDHAIEHEQKKLKVKGGFQGITNKEGALERFALTSPILSQMSTDYLSCYAKSTNQSKRIHHEMLGSSFNSKINKASLLVKTLSREGNPFAFEDLTNLMNFSVPNSNVVKDVVHRDELGLEALENFRKKRMTPESIIPFWDPYEKINICMFSDTEVKLKNISFTTTLKTERLLYARMLLLSKSRPDLCPKSIIGDYEFSNIPASNFLTNGKMITLESKTSLLSKIQNIKLENYSPLYVSDKQATLIIHGMRLIDDMKKMKVIKTAQDLADVFTSELEKISEHYTEIRLIFPQYLANSLKESAIESRSVQKKRPIHFHVNSTTPIKSIEQFLRHVKTRSEVTKFLGNAVLHSFKKTTKKILVAYHNKFWSNGSMSVATTDLLGISHTLEGAEQIILLNAVDVARQDINRKLFVYAKDDETMVLLTNFYEMIPPATLFCNEEIGAICHRLGKLKSKALLGWYTFKGTEITGAFAGKGMGKQFIAFKDSDDTVLNTFCSFGEESIDPSDLISGMERFTCLLYGQNLDTNIKDLRYTMSFQKGLECTKLPPTLGTLVPHIHRAFWLAMTWKKSIQPLSSPSPLDFYWYVDENEKYQPVMCTKPAAPDTFGIMTKCGCKSTSRTCNKLSCNCFKNGLLCSDLCACNECCQNKPGETFNISPNDDLLG